MNFCNGILPVERRLHDLVTIAPRNIEEHVIPLGAVGLIDEPTHPKNQIGIVERLIWMMEDKHFTILSLAQQGSVPAN